VLAAHEACTGVNGAPRILADPPSDGEVASRKTVAKLMREQGPAGISPATWHPVTTIGDGSPHTIPDLVDRDFVRGRLDAVWTSDITHPATAERLATPMRGPRRLLTPGAGLGDRGPPAHGT
jgi:hypothetical protein